MSRSGYSLKATAKKFEGKFAVLDVEERQTLRWPIKELPDDIQEGMPVKLIISSEKSELEEDEQQAKKMLNALLDA